MELVFEPRQPDSEFRFLLSGHPARTVSLDGVGSGTVGDPESELFLLKDIVRSNTSICLFGSHKDAIFLESSSDTDLCSSSGSDTKGVSAAERTKED